MCRFTKAWQGRFSTSRTKSNKRGSIGLVPGIEPLERRELLAGDLTTLDAATENQPPVAVDDSLTAYQGTPLRITSAALLANDTDADGDALKVTLVAGSGPEHGTLSLVDGAGTPIAGTSNAGGFVYLPQGDFTGDDHFLYFAWDGKAFSAATTVTIHVQPIVGLPTARDDYYSTPVNTALVVAAPGVLANDGRLVPLDSTTPLDGTTPPDGTPPRFAPPGWPLQAELVAGPAPETGKLDFHSDGSFTYTPAADFTGTATFTYRDATLLASPQAGAASTSPVAGNIATVTIAVKAVNTFTEAHNDYYQTKEAAALIVAAPGVLGNDRSPSGKPLTAVQVSGPQHGSLVLLADGSFTYSPDKDFVGLDSFVYRASDTPPGSLDPITNQPATTPQATTDPSAPISRGSLATVTISVTPINPLPEARNDSYVTTQEATLSVDSAHGVLANDSAPAGQALSALLLTVPTHGKVTLAADGSFVYTPTGDYRGVDTFVYRAKGSPITTPPGTTDTTGASGEGDATVGPDGIITRPPHDTATVSIYVRPLNLPPAAQNDQYAMQQGGVMSIAAPGVLANDKHADNQTLIAAPVAGHGPQHGQLMLSPNGSFTYTPDAAFSGIDTFLYQATALSSNTSAGTAAGDVKSTSVATVVIFVRPLNPPPEARSDTYVATVGTPLVVGSPGVLANDSAAAGHSLTAVLLTQPRQGKVQFDDQGDGGFTYSPPDDFTGVVTFTYQAKDDTPPPTTEPPTTPTADAALVVTGDPTRPPPIARHDIATVTIFVKPLNPPPEAHGDTYTTAQGTTLTIAAPGVLANDLAPVGHGLTATLVDGHGPQHGQVSLLPDGSFTYIPDAAFYGRDTFTYQANDVAATPGGTAAAAAVDANGNINTRPPSNVAPSNVAVVTIYVTPVRPPIEAHDDIYPTGINKQLVVSAPGVLANDFGPSAQPLTATLLTKPEHGDLVFNSNGSFTYTPEQDFSGDVKFTYRAAAASSAVTSATSADGPVATVTIYVLPQDPLPKFKLEPLSRSTDESGPQTVPDFALPVVAGGDATTPQAPAFVVTCDKPGLFKEQPAIDASGKLTYAPAPNASGSAAITVSMTSGDTTETRLFTITIDKPHPLMNAANPRDVSDDGVVAPIDALLVINYLNAHGSGAASNTGGEGESGSYLDSSGDNIISPLDALLVINWLNAGGGSGAGGEGESPTAADSIDADTIALLALNAIDSQGRPKHL